MDWKKKKVIDTHTEHDFHPIVSFQETSIVVSEGISFFSAALWQSNTTRKVQEKDLGLKIGTYRQSDYSDLVWKEYVIVAREYLLRIF